MRIWFSRLLIGIVTAWNLQAALIFISSPNMFAGAYELSDVPGEAALRGIGVLFLMWNVPYLVALWDPIRFRRELILALAMQFIGLIGESMILSTLPNEHIVLRTSIIRFVIFDGIGLLLLMIAYGVQKAAVLK